MTAIRTSHPSDECGALRRKRVHPNNNSNNNNSNNDDDNQNKMTEFEFAPRIRRTNAAHCGGSGAVGFEANPARELTRRGEPENSNKRIVVL